MAKNAKKYPVEKARGSAKIRCTSVGRPRRADREVGAWTIIDEQQHR